MYAFPFPSTCHIHRYTFRTLKCNNNAHAIRDAHERRTALLVLF